MIDQSVIDRAVNIATKAALSCYPVKKITWIPPTTAASDPRGIFAIEGADAYTASETPPWDKL